MVTSRDHLLGLVATENADALVLHRFGNDEARELLSQRLGADRVATEPDSVQEIIQRCAGLPLALAVAAARAATRPQLALAALAEDLATCRDGLEVFAGEDAGTNLRSVFSASYRMVNSPARRLFRLLGSHSGRQVPLPAPRQAWPASRYRRRGRW